MRTKKGRLVENKIDFIYRTMNEYICKQLQEAMEKVINEVYFEDTSRNVYYIGG